MSQIIINGQPLYQVDLPEMTLAEWIALPVAERPKEWIRTDAEYTDIPAENVSYGGGSVKGALDEVLGRIGDIAYLGQVSMPASSTSTVTIPDSEDTYIGIVRRFDKGKTTIWIIDKGTPYAISGGGFSNLSFSIAGTTLTITNNYSHAVTIWLFRVCH